VTKEVSMRTLLMSLSILAGATMAAASPASAAPRPVAPVAQPLALAQDQGLVQPVQWHDWRYRQWRRHEAYDRWRRHEAWRHRGYGYGYGRPWGGPPGRAYGYYRRW
jgi:hypothetical protein